MASVSECGQAQPSTNRAASPNDAEADRFHPLLSLAGPDQLDQLGRDLVQGQDKINIAGLDGRLRHAKILRRGTVLSDDPAALLLDDLHPK